MMGTKYRAWQKISSLHRQINTMHPVKGLHWYDQPDSNGWGEVLFEKSSEYANDVELMPYTGIKDDHGQDIYAGDIIEFIDFRGNHVVKQSKHDGYTRGWHGVVEWSDSNGWFLNKKNGHNERLCKKRGREQYDKWCPYVYYMDTIKTTAPMVIGNIYENPDLLT